MGWWSETAKQTDRQTDTRGQITRREGVVFIDTISLSLPTLPRSNTTTTATTTPTSSRPSIDSLAMDQPSNSPVTSKQGAEDDRPKRARKTKRIVEQVELSKELKHCQRVVVSLLSHRYASPFAAPVDAVRLNIPDYYTVIKNPMDFGTIKVRA